MNIQITGLSKIYPNGHAAIKDVNLRIGSGMFGLLGPNGAGKTTMFRMIIGKEKPGGPSSQAIDRLGLRLGERARLQALLLEGRLVGRDLRAEHAADPCRRGYLPSRLVSSSTPRWDSRRLISRKERGTFSTIRISSGIQPIVKWAIGRRFRPRKELRPCR